MDYLTKEQILTAKDIIEEDVDVPEWGGKVRIRSFTVEQARKLNEDAKGPDDKADPAKYQALLFVYGVINPKFDAADAAELNKKSMGAMAKVLLRITEISGLSEKAVETSVKTFPEAAE